MVKRITGTRCCLLDEATDIELSDFFNGCTLNWLHSIEDAVMHHVLLAKLSRVKTD